MAVDKVTAAQFTQRITKAISARNNTYDTAVGPIPDLITIPVGRVLESQNDDIRKLESLLKLLQDGSYSHDDLVAFVANEGVKPDLGSRAYATLVFSATRVVSDLPVQAGYPVATIQDESSGQSLTFVTIDTATLPVVDKAAYFNPDTQRFELKILAECTVTGALGNVGSNRIIRPLRPLIGFDSVYNVEAAQGGRDETNDAELIEQYLIAITGTDEATDDGTRRIVRDLFTNVEDALISRGSDALVTRAATDAGAVDVWALGIEGVTRTDVGTFIGTLQPIILIRQPVLDVVRVSQGSTVYTRGSDYDLIYDTSGYSGSVRGMDAIVFNTRGLQPAVGSALTIQYIQNFMIENMQNVFNSPEHQSHGRDLLVRQATQVDLTLSATIVARSGYNINDLVDMTTNGILTFINSTKLSGRIPGISNGGSIQLSDINAQARKISGVDNFIITQFSILGQTGIHDISLANNQYARIAIDDINIIPS